jgi:hypothetical protein
MNHIEQSEGAAQSDRRLPLLAFYARILETSQEIEEDGDRIFEGNSVFGDVDLSLIGIPDKWLPATSDLHVH